MSGQQGIGLDSDSLSLMTRDATKSMSVELDKLVKTAKPERQPVSDW